MSETLAPLAAEVEALRNEYIFDPNILRRIQVGEAQTSLAGHSQIFRNDIQRAYGIVDIIGAESNKDGKKVAEAAQQSLDRSLSHQFDRNNPQHSMRGAFDRAQTKIIDTVQKRFGKNKPVEVAASAVKFYQEANGALKMVVGASGDVRIYSRSDATENPVSIIASGTWQGDRLAESMTDDRKKFNPRSLLVDVAPNDRYIIMSDVISAALEAKPEIMQAALQEPNPQAAADSINDNTKPQYDGSILVIDIPADSDATPTVVSGTEEHTGSHALGETEEPKTNRMRQMLGRLAVWRKPDSDAPAPTRQRRTLNGAAVVGYAKLTDSDARRERQQQREQKRNQRYAEQGLSQEEIDGRRKFAKINLGILAVVGGVVAGIFLKKAGMDVVPTHLPFGLGDGDGVDYLPFHGPTSYHGDGILGTFLDDDPARPARAAQRAAEAAGENNNPPAVPPAWQPAHYNMDGARVQTNSYEGLISLVADGQVGAGNLSGGEIHTIYQDMHRDFGNDWIDYTQPHAGPDTYVINGDNVGLSHPGEVQLASQAIEQKLREEIAWYAAT